MARFYVKIICSSVVMGAFRASFLSGINTATLAGSLLVCVIVGILFSGLYRGRFYVGNFRDHDFSSTGSAANYLLDSGNPIQKDDDGSVGNTLLDGLYAA
ncbi:MAG: hypothetical protein R2874_03030 [Desulfobacterales bacterium]